MITGTAVMAMFNEYGDVLTVKEVCTILRISRNMAYELVREGKIRCVKVGNRYRIPKTEIVRFLERCYTINSDGASAGRRTI